MTLLVTGAAGQLGHDVARAGRSAASNVLAYDRSMLDLTRPDTVAHVIDSSRPAVVVNCAAYTAVDACETNVEQAYAVNEHGVRSLAVACAATGAHLIHISTDYVFDGRSERPYREDDHPNPQSVYGRSKRAGEIDVLDVLGDRCTVVRTSWVCGEHGSNMVKTVLRVSDPPRPLTFVDDQRGHPSFTADLAPALRQLAVDRRGGIFHLTNAGLVSWYEFVREVLQAAGRDPDMVSPISTDELQPPRPAVRPANSALDNAAWRAAGYTPLRHFREPLGELVTRLLAQNRSG